MRFKKSKGKVGTASPSINVARSNNAAKMALIRAIQLQVQVQRGNELLNFLLNRQKNINRKRKSPNN
jgi:hypothetical protein